MAHTPHIPAPFQLRLALHCVMQLPVNGLGLLAPDCSSWGVPARGTSKRSPINVFGNIFLQWVQDSGCMVARRHACTRHPSMGCGTIMSYTSDQRLPEDCITYIGHSFPECTVGLGTATWVTSWKTSTVWLALQPRVLCVLPKLAHGVSVAFLGLSTLKPMRWGMENWDVDGSSWRTHTKEDVVIQLHARNLTPRFGPPEKRSSGSSYWEAFSSMLCGSGLWNSLKDRVLGYYHVLPNIAYLMTYPEENTEIKLDVNVFMELLISKKASTLA